MNGNEIVKAAQLGTDKYIPGASPALRDTGSKIMAGSTDKEDRFLKLAIATLLFEEAGQKPIQVEGEILECTPEVLSRISENLAGNIHAALSMKEEVLFHYFIYLAHNRNQVLAAELVPIVLNKALEQKKAARQLVSACGETGKWLCRLNANWRTLTSETAEENVWETGSMDNRKKFFVNIRKSDPAKAVELLESVIDKESAANRAEFVELLQAGLSPGDEPFLQRLLSDKSQKVKEAALRLLQKLQGSVINTRYLDYLLTVILVKEERYLLITKRKVLTIREDITPGDDIFNTGIGKVSSDKGVADHIYVTGQLLRFIDPAILANRLAVTEEELVTLLLQHPEADHLRPFLSMAAAEFRSRAWAIKLFDAKDAPVALLNALPENERANYYDLFIDTQLQSLLPYLLDDRYSRFLLSLTRRLLEHLSKNPYATPHAVLQRLALHMPDEALALLRSYTEKPGADHKEVYFRAQVTEMARIMEIRNNAN